jgi:hypothetical protein
MKIFNSGLFVKFGQIFLRFVSDPDPQHLKLKLTLFDRKATKDARNFGTTYLSASAPLVVFREKLLFDKISTL